jgi:hypothetical protein
MKIEIVHCPDVREHQNNNAKVTSLVTLIKKRFGIEAVITPGKTGQFEVIADGEKIAERGGNWFTRKFGAGYPELGSVLEQLEKHRASDAAR